VPSAAGPEIDPARPDAGLGATVELAEVGEKTEMVFRLECPDSAEGCAGPPTLELAPPRLLRGETQIQAGATQGRLAAANPTSGRNWETAEMSCGNDACGQTAYRVIG
jgi:hypothetical protein